MTIITGILNLGRTIWIIAFIYAFLANAFFLVSHFRPLSVDVHSLRSMNITIH